MRSRKENVKKSKSRKVEMNRAVGEKKAWGAGSPRDVADGGDVFLDDANCRLSIADCRWKDCGTRFDLSPIRRFQTASSFRRFDVSTFRHLHLLSLILVAFGFSPALGGDERKPIPPAPAGSPSARPAATTPNKTVAPSPPSAEDILKEFRRQRPNLTPIQPTGASDHDGKPRAQLWPEGFGWVDRTGYLERGGSWWMFISADGEDQVRIKTLPNATLESMVSGLTHETEPIRFVIAGELTVFEDENYLLVRAATRERRPEPVASARSDRPQLEVSKSTAEDVASRLRELQPRQNTLPPGTTPHPSRPRGLTSSTASSLEGSTMVRRPGRLIRSGDWWTFVFESDHPDYPEAPMKLLPNLSVELMARNSVQSEGGAVFTLSGEITAFEGENYLLPRSVLRRVELGNVRK